jgi:hypothetical protein
LIDHGTYAYTTFFIVLGFDLIININHILFYGMFYLMTISPFYLRTWVEYVTGEMILPTFNDVSDGSVILVFIEIFTGIKGGKFWIGKFSIFNLEMINWFLCFVEMIGGIVFILFFNVKIFR